MKKYLSFFFIVLPSYLFGQSVYMHEAQDDAANSEPISFMGIVTLLIIVGIVYVIYKFVGTALEKRNERKYIAYNAEYKRQKETRMKGGFICPICGKQVLDDSYWTRIWSKNQTAYAVKICNSCNDKYYPIRHGKKRKPVPTWVYALPYVFLVGIGLFVLIRNIIIGEIFLGIIGMIITPVVIGGVLGWVFIIIKKIISIPEPKSPLNDISLEHIRDCNAIKD